MELLKYLLVALLCLIGGIFTEENINTEDRHEDLPPLFQDVSIIFSPKMSLKASFYMFVQISILLEIGS